MFYVLFLSSPSFDLCWWVLLPFFYSFYPFDFEWSSYRIEWFNQTIKPYLRVLYRTIICGAIHNRTCELDCFILETTCLLIYFAQTRVVPRNIYKKATWSWLNLIISFTVIRLFFLKKSTFSNAENNRSHSNQIHT